MVVASSGVAMAFTGVQLALNDASPSQQTLGTINGVALTIQSGVRAFTPTLFSSIFAVGVKKHILGGQLGILVLTACAACFFVIACFLRVTPADKPQDREADEEEG